MVDLRDRTLPHIALVYTDARDRNKLLKYVVKERSADWGSVVVLSSDPSADTKFFGGMEWKAACRKARPVSPVDMREMVHGRPELSKEVSRTINAAFQSKHRGSTPLVVGDWLHHVYDRFDIGLEVEEHLAEKKFRNLICCLRCEGFWSLNVKHIARAVLAHEQIVFLGQSTLKIVN